MAIDRGGSIRRGTPRKPKVNKPKKKKTDKPKAQKPSIPSSYQPSKKASPSLPKTVKPKKDIKKDYNSFKKSSFKPTITNTSNKTMREQAQIGFKAYQKAKNRKVVGTQKPSNISNNLTDSFKVKENEYAKALNKGKKANGKTVGSQKPGNVSNNITDSFKVKKGDYQKALDKGKKVNNKTVGTKIPDKKDNPFTDWSKPFEKGYSLEKDYKKAAKKGLKTTNLGTKQKEKTVDLASPIEKKVQKFQERKAYYDSKEWKDAKKELKKTNVKEWRSYLTKELGWSKEEANEWLNSEEGLEYRKESYNEMKDAVKKDINKEISKGVEKRNKLKTVNALTKQQFQQMETATRLGKDLGNKYLDSVDKNLGEIIGSKTVEAGLRSKFAYGVMQGMSKADIWSGSVGRYNEAARTGMEQVKDSGSYMLGYGVGLAADMGMGGVASRGASLSKGIPKVAAQLAGKGVPEKAAVEVADEVAKLSRAEGTKLFFKNRTGELAAELPTNVLDATKMSLDADGNLDKKSFRNWLIINNAFTFGMGGLMEGVGAKITKDLANETSELIAKKQAGTISKEEVDKLAKNIQKISKKTQNENSLSGAIARDVKNEADTFDQAVKDARLQRKLDKANARTERKAKAKEEQARLEEENRIREAEAKAKAREEELNTAYKNYDPEYLEKENIDLNRQIRKIDNKTKKLKGQAKNSKTLEGHERIGAKQRELAKEREGLEQALKENEGKLKNIEHSKTTTASARELNNRLKEIFKEKKVAGTHEKYQRLANEEKAIKERLQQIQDLHKTAMKTEELIAKQQAGTLTEAEAKELNKNVRYLKNRKGREAGLDIEVPKPKTLKERYDDANLPFWMEQHSPQNIKEQIKEHEENLIPRLEAEVKKALNEQRKAFARGQSQEGYRLSKTYNGLKDELEDAKSSLEAYKKADEINEKFGGAETKAEVKEEARTVEKSTEIPTKTKNIPEPDPNAVKEADEVFGDQTIGKTPKKKQTYEDLQNSSNSLNAKDRQKVETKGKEVEKKVKKNNEEKWKFWKWFQGAFVSELRPLEEIAMQSERADLRKRGRVTINKLLTAKAKAREMIQSRGVKMFVDRNLHKNVEKANFYDTYVLLMHDLDRVKQKVITARTKDGDIINVDFGRELVTKKQPDGSWKKIDFKPFKDHEGVKWDFNNMDVDSINDFLKKNDLDIDGKIRDKSMSGMLEDEIESVLKNMRDPKLHGSWATDVQEFQKELVDYHHDLLKIDAESGIIPMKGIDGLEGLEKRYKNYVPSFREGDSDLLVNELPIEKNYFGTTIDTASSLKDIKGGTTLNGIFPMYTQMVVKTEKVMKRAAENDMFNVIAQINGVKPEQLPRGHTPSELLEVSSGVYKSQKSGTYKVYFRQNGKGVSMDISEDVYHAIRKWSGEERAAIMEFKIGKALSDPKLQLAASTFKAFITDYSLIFGARNFFRDTATALVYAERPLQWIAAFPKAIMSLSGKGKYGKAFQQYVKDGGRYSALVTSTDLSKAIKPGKKEGIPGLRYIKEFNTALETLPRMSEYIATVERLGKAKNLDWEKALENTKITDEALYNAKEVTLNFDRAGTYGRILNKGLVPFFNPSLQGIDKLRRVLYADNKSLREFVGMIGKISGGAMIPAVAWELFVGKDENYQKLSAYNKYTYFCIPLGKDENGDPEYLKIPRAREMAALQMPIEWVFQNIKYGSRDGEANLFESFKRSFSMNPMHPGLAYEQIGPVNPLTDNYFSPFINLLRNKDWMGYNIEGYTDKEKRNDERINDIYDTETSTLAVMLQSWTNDHVDSALKFFGIDGEAGEWIRKHKVSPKQLDSMMDSYLGVIYDMGIRPFSLKGASVKEGKENPKDFFTQWASSTFGSSFIVNGTLSSSRRTEMYAKIDSYNKKLESLPEGSDEYNEVNYKLTQLKNNVTYDVQALDFAIDGINRNKKLTQKQKAYLTNAIKREQNGIIDDYNDGKKHQKDPLKYLLELKDKDGKKVFTTEEVINNFTYTNEKNGKNTIRDSYDLLKESDYYKKHPKKATREFLDITFSTREVASKCGDSKTFVDYETMAVVCTDKANKTGKNYQEIIDAYHVGKKQMKMADVYINQMGGDTDTYTASHRHIVEGASKLGLFTKDLQSHDYAMILANAKTKNGNRLKDRAYWIENPNNYGTYSYAYQRMNPARCLSSDKYKDSNWTYKKVHKFASKYGLDWSSPDKKIEDAINERYPNKTREEKAALFEVIKPTDDNPFGKIGDYSENGDSGIGGKGGYGRGRRGHGHGGGGGNGGGGGSSTFTPLINTAGKKAKVSNTSKKSNLDDAYRKKLKKLREEQKK